MGGCICLNHTLFFSSFLSIRCDVGPRVALSAQAESGQVIAVAAEDGGGRGAGRWARSGDVIRPRRCTGVSVYKAALLCLVGRTPPAGSGR